MTHNAQFAANIFNLVIQSSRTPHETVAHISDGIASGGFNVDGLETTGDGMKDVENFDSYARTLAKDFPAYVRAAGYAHWLLKTHVIEGGEDGKGVDVTVKDFTTLLTADKLFATMATEDGGDKLKDNAAQRAVGMALATMFLSKSVQKGTAGVVWAGKIGAAAGYGSAPICAAVVKTRVTELQSKYDSKGAVKNSAGRATGSGKKADPDADTGDNGVRPANDSPDAARVAAVASKAVAIAMRHADAVKEALGTLRNGSIPTDLRVAKAIEILDAVKPLKADLTTTAATTTAATATATATDSGGDK